MGASPSAQSCRLLAHEEKTERGWTFIVSEIQKSDTAVAPVLRPCCQSAFARAMPSCPFSAKGQLNPSFEPRWGYYQDGSRVEVPGFRVSGYRVFGFRHAKREPNFELQEAVM
jgi:hypothetical protein